MMTTDNDLLHLPTAITDNRDRHGATRAITIGVRVIV